MVFSPLARRILKKKKTKDKKKKTDCIELFLHRSMNILGIV